MKVNWDHVKEVWDAGLEDLGKIARMYEITIPEIQLKAQKEGWGDRGGEVPLFPKFNDPVLSDTQVILSHKTDVGRLRLVAATLLESLQLETDKNAALKLLERITKIYSQIIPLERSVFGLDKDSDDMPEGIFIRSKKTVIKSE